MYMRSWLIGLVGAGLLLVGAVGTAVADYTCNIPQGSTTCTVEEPLGGVIVPAGQPLLDAKVVNLSDCTALTYRLFIRGGLSYEASLLPGQDNFDGPGVSTGGDIVGRFPPGTYPTREVFEFRVQPGCPPGLRAYVGRAISGLRTYSEDGRHRYHFNVSAIDLLQTGRGIRRYTGNDWDPRGGPIQIFLGRTLIRTFGAAASFRGTVPAGFPDSTCLAELRARQDGITRTIRAPRARRAERVAFAEGRVEVTGGRALRTGDSVCEGEDVTVGPGSAFVGQAVPSGAARYKGLRIVNRQTDVEVPGGIFAPTVVVGLSRGRAVTIAGQGIAVAQFDPERSDALNFNRLPTGRVASLDRVIGLQRADGDLTVGGAVTVDNGLLFADGSLTLLGGVSGVGVLAAAGELRLQGPVRFRSDVEDGVALAAGRKITLLGKGR